jgi:hypothetical protein
MKFSFPFQEYRAEKCEMISQKYTNIISAKKHSKICPGYSSKNPSHYDGVSER